MSANVLYLAVGEEAARGTPESSTVGFLPITSSAFPAYEPEDVRRQEFRGESVAKGAVGMRRLGEKWSFAPEINVYSEAGSTAGMFGTLYKHLLGKGTSAQNGATGQYYHMLYPVEDMFTAGSGKVGAGALTMNMNGSQGATTKNTIFGGGRNLSGTFVQEPGQLLKFTPSYTGQDVTANQTAIATPTYPAENLALDFSNLTVYTGTITRTGTGPDFTEFAFGSANSLCPDRVEVTIETGNEDKTRLCGQLYPTQTTQGVYKVTFSMTLNFTTAGFDSVTEWNTWLAGTSQTNFFLHWDTGTQAGTGDNHSLYIDLPVCQRMGGDPEFSLDRDPVITLNYECDYDATTTKYIIGMMLKNTATAI